MSKEMILFIGIQGSGKTFCYNKLFADRYMHICLDVLHTRNKEQLKMDECLRENKSFVVDNTNPTRDERRRYIAQAKKYGYRTIGYFFESKIQDCIERNNLRSGKAKLLPKAIAATSNKLQLPSFAEGFDELYFAWYEGEKLILEKWRE